MNPLQGIRGVPVTLSPLKAVAQTPAAPMIGPTVADQVVLDGSSLAPPPPPPVPVEEQQPTPLPPAPPPPAPVKANVPNEVGGFLIAGAAPQAPAEPQWEDKTNPDGSTFKQRLIESEDGGPKWREILFEGHPPYQKRLVKAADGGPDWTQMRFPGQANRPGYQQRNIPSTDGGPAWLEKQIDGKSAQKTRQVPATDGGKPWNEVAYPTGGSWKSRKAAAEDGGNEWTEIVKNGTLTRSRTKAAEDGKGDWNEVQSASGHRLNRTYTENGLEWRESINGNNRFRCPAEGVAGLAKAAAAIGTTTLDVDGVEIKIHGGATPRELDLLRTAIQAMPPGARVYAQDITLTDNLGEALGPDGDSTSREVGGLAAGKQIALSRNHLKNQYSANRLIFHESGHVADTENLELSSRPPWGQESSVTIYGQTNRKEDFAETHRVVLADFERYSSMSAADWACESQADKKMQIARLYGGNVPSAEEVKAAENAETIRKRDLMAKTDAVTQGSEKGKVTPAEDGGAPWTEYYQGDKLAGRSRKVASSDDGPGWTEFQLDGAKPFKQRGLEAGDGGPNWTEKVYEGGAHSKFRTIPAADGGPNWTERMQDNGSKYKERILKAEDGGPSWQETQFDGRKPFKKRTLAAEDGGPKWSEYQFEGSGPYKQREVPATDGGAAWKEIQFPDKPLRSERPVAAKDGGPAWTEVRSDGRRFLKRQVVEGGVKINEHWENGKMVRKQA